VLSKVENWAASVARGAHLGARAVMRPCQDVWSDEKEVKQKWGEFRARRRRAAGSEWSRRWRMRCPYVGPHAINATDAGHRDVGNFIAHKPGSGTAGRRARAPNNRETGASRACPAGSASPLKRRQPRNPPPARRRRRPLVHTRGSGVSSTLEPCRCRARTTSR